MSIANFVSEESTGENIDRSEFITGAVDVLSSNGVEGEALDTADGIPVADNQNLESTTKDNVAKFLEAVATDAKPIDSISDLKKSKEASENEIGDADTPMDNVDQEWLKQQNEANRPALPESLGGKPKVADDGLVYFDYVISVDPTKYTSNNYRPIANAGKIGKNKGGKINSDKGGADKETVEQTEAIEITSEPEKDNQDNGEPDISTGEIAKAAKLLSKKKGIEEERATEIVKATLNGDYEIDEDAISEFASFLPEENSVLKKIRELAEEDNSKSQQNEEAGKKEDKGAEDKAPEKVSVDYAMCIDGSSFACYDDFGGIDYSKITMDISPRRAPTRQTCQTTFEQCRAENPLFCRFHGPKLIEADIRQMIMARLNRQGIGTTGVVVNVSRDGDNRVSRNGNSLRFKVSVGCLSNQVTAVKGQLDAMFGGFGTRDSIPGITEVGGRLSTERNEGGMNVNADLEMDLLRADQPPRSAAERRAAERNASIGGEQGGNQEEEETGNEEVETAEGNRGQGEPPQTREAPVERAEEPRQPQPEETPNNVPQEENAQPNNIEHLEGGINARFSESEISAINRLKREAFNQLNDEDPENAELASYAHTISNLMGSSQSAHGRRTNALRGIRDGITKAELLEKAEQRLARTADADNPDRYNGAVRAIRDIANICGIDGLEIDGTNISLANKGQEPARAERAEREERADGQEREENPEPPIVQGGENENPQPESQEEGNNGNNNEVPQPTAEEIERVAERIAGISGTPAAEARRAIMQRLNGETPITASELSMFNRLFPSGVMHDTVNRIYEAQERARAGRGSAQTPPANSNGVESVNNVPQNAPEENEEPLEVLSVGEALSRIPPTGAATRAQIRAKREENEAFWGGDPSTREIKNGIVAANRMGMSREVRTADAAIARESMPDVKRLQNPNFYEITSSQSYGDHGCNCWKTVAAAFLRIRGFDVKARSQNEASPVFANTDAAEGQQKLTFIESQLAMSNAYERITEETVIRTRKHLDRILNGNLKGHPPTMPAPDGTLISRWNGGHCTGYLVYKGRLFEINPFYGGTDGLVPISSSAAATAITRASINKDFTRTLPYVVAEYRRNKAAAHARGERYHLPNHSIEKLQVGLFLRKQCELRKTNRNVTDAEVIEAVANDDTNKIIQGSYVIRPTEPLIPAMFGLSKPA